MIYFVSNGDLCLSATTLTAFHLPSISTYHRYQSVATYSQHYFFRFLILGETYTCKIRLVVYNFILLGIRTIHIPQQLGKLF